jgi:hypothetical protein
LDDEGQKCKNGWMSLSLGWMEMEAAEKANEEMKKWTNEAAQRTSK